MPRPTPETGQFEMTIVDFQIWKRRALADGHVSDAEGKELIAITEAMARQGGRIARTVQFVAKALTCKDGLRSRTVREAWAAEQAEPVRLDDYRTTGPDAA